VTQKSGDQYERLTQRVFQYLLGQSHAANVRVEHDVNLSGISGVTYQTDVYWEFQVGGLTHRVVVECKDKGRPVEKATVSSLLGVLADLPGQPRGVIVARSGFQEGAKQLAASRGITLYELREPEDSDWDGFLRAVVVTGVLHMPKVHAVQFLLQDYQADAETIDRLGMAQVPRTAVMAGRLNLEREDGSAAATFADVIAKHLLPAEVGVLEWREHLFPEPLYIQTGYPDMPRVRLRGVKVRIELVIAHKMTTEFRLDDLVKLILKDVTDGTWRALTADGQPLDEEQPQPRRLVQVRDK